MSAKDALAKIGQSPEEQAALGEKPRLRLVPMWELIQDRTPPEYLVKGWIPAKGTGWLYGPPGCGKSWVALDLSTRIATGMEWQGCRVKSGPVAYLAGEAAEGIKLRLAAWNKVHPEVERPPVYVSDTGGSFSPEGLEEVKQAIDALEVSPVLIVVDTQARWQSGNENSTEDGGAYVRAIDELRDRYGCHVLSVHHSGKDADRGMRGSTAYRGAADVELKAQAVDVDGVKHFTLSASKVKDGAEPAPVHWQLEPHTLADWLDVDGEPVQSAYMIEEEETPALQGGGNKKMVPPDEIKRLVDEYPEAGKNELYRIMADRFNLAVKTAKARLAEQEGLGVLKWVDGPGGRKLAKWRDEK